MSRAWMPLYVADYLADTAHLSCVESGAYLHLIMHYWQHRGLPVQPERLARIAKLSLDEWAAVAPTIAELFNKDWKHGRIEQELASSDAAYARRAEAGSKGGLAKARGQAAMPAGKEARAHDPPSNAIAETKQCSSNAVAITSQHSTKLASLDAREKKKPDVAGHETYRACLFASRWKSDDAPHADTIGPLHDLIAEGYDLERRILPVIATKAGELDRFGRDPPDQWSYFVPVVKDQTFKPDSRVTPVDTVIVREGDEKWNCLIASGKKVSFLASMLKQAPDGKGRYLQWPADKMPAKPAARSA